MTTATQTQLARLRTALNDLNDLTGGMRSEAGDLAFTDAWVALHLLEQDAAAPVVDGGGQREAAA